METSRVCERTSCEESEHIVYICRYTPYRAATVLPGVCRIVKLSRYEKATQFEKNLLLAFVVFTQ